MSACTGDFYYLKQTEGRETRTCNNDDFKLRGVKQYWLQQSVQKNPETVLGKEEGAQRNPGAASGKEEGKQRNEKASAVKKEGEQKNPGAASANEKIRSDIAPIEVGSEFEGTVRFHNMTAEELGLLLWSIRLEKGSQMNIGKGKPFGYGRICLDQIVLYLQNPQAAYDISGDPFGRKPFERQTEEARDAFVAAYQKTLAAWLGAGKGEEKPDRDIIMSNPSIRDFFGMKAVIGQGRDVAYMTMEEFKQHKLRNHPLPEASKYIKSNTPVQAYGAKHRGI